MSSSSPPGRIRGQEAAAAAIGTNYRTLQRWQKESWFPAAGRTAAGYDVAAIRDAAIIVGRLAARDSSPPVRDSDSQTARKLKLAREAEGLKRDGIRRQHDELKLRQAENDLIPRIAIEQSYADLLTGIADWCEQLPDVYVSMISVPKKYHARCRSLLKKLIEQRQHELADELAAKALTSNKEQRTPDE